MKILYDLEAYAFGPHGGIARIFDETIRRLATRADYRACLYAPSPIAGGPATGQRVRPARWRALPRRLEPVGAVRRPVRAIERVYWRTVGADVFHPTFYMSRPNVPARVPRVVHVYDLIHEQIENADDMPDHGVFKAYKRDAIERAARIVCISESTRADLLEYYAVDPGAVRVARLGATDAFSPMPAEEARRRVAELGVEPEKPFLLFVGSRQRYKNFHGFLYAYARWAARAEADVVVVGAPRGVTDSLAHDLAGPGGAVRYVGCVSDETLRALYSIAAFFVYPSLCEGFGIPLLEAMACGAPLCVSDIPAFREVAADAAQYFDPGSTSAMHDAFDACLARGRTDEMRAKYRARLACFSWDTCAEETWGVYRELVQ